MTTRARPQPMWSRPLSIFAAIATTALLSSCASFDWSASEPEPQATVVEKKPPPEPIKPPPPSRLYEWYGSDQYISHIEVSINEQKARFFSGDKVVGWTTIASGVQKYPTPTGSFAVLEKAKKKKSNLYGKIYDENGKLVNSNAKIGIDPIPDGGRFEGASMPYFLRFTNDGIGMHAGPIPRPGRRASHGCIRMPWKFAPVLYRYVDSDTAVTIKGNGPTYATYLVQQRKSARKPAPTAEVKPNPVPTEVTAATPADPANAQSAAASASSPTGSVQADAAASAPVAGPVSAPTVSAPAESSVSATPPANSDSAPSSPEVLPAREETPSPALIPPQGTTDAALPREGSGEEQPVPVAAPPAQTEAEPTGRSEG